MGIFFPEIVKQEKLIKKVIQEEEQAFLHTLEQGLGRLDKIIIEKLSQEGKNKESGKKIDMKLNGEKVFELYDTYGFPADLTALIIKDYYLEIDEAGFNKALEEQRTRSRKATSSSTEDWIEINPQTQTIFTGYESLQEKSHIIKYRKTTLKGKDQYQIVLDKTPFYAESGGQVGDTGFLESNNKRIKINNTQKENNLIIHFSK